MRPLTATIDTAALAHNLAVARVLAPAAQVLAVIKANAYGHGVVPAARAFAAADGLALIELEAAVRLRESGYAGRLVLLEGLFDAAELAVAADHRLTVVVHCEEQLRMLDAAPADVRLDVLFKLNTGMNRLGFALAPADDALTRLRAHRAVGAVTLMMHFATADEARGVTWQLDVFNRFAVTRGLACSLANSAALLRHAQTRTGWVRPGIMLYGCSPFAEAPAAGFGLKPAMTLASRVIAVQQIKAGDSVGYGSAFIADRAMRIGVVACGYADGYPRHAPTGTPVLVAGRRTRTVGRIAMDLLCCDLTAIADAATGTPVVLWGDGLPADDVAAAAGTVSYELLCALAPRVPVTVR
jgi:alanine racemase